jgi:chromosome segregation ATPase
MNLSLSERFPEERMSEQDEQVTVVQDGGSNAGKWILLAVAAAYVAASLYFLVDLRGHVNQLTQNQAAGQKQIADLTTRMQAAEAEAETLGQQVGITKKELSSRAAQLQASQRAAEERLAKEQKEQISAVSGEVAGVKTDVGGVKTDVATTKSDLEATKAKLESTIGDLGLQSGLVAKTRDDLEVLKHKGDRQYYEFTLLKGAKPQPVSTVSLQVKKLDAKRGKFTLNVTSDDKTIEKKDRNVNEPIQFYTGRDHMLYELVVWTLDKNKATGYVSTPKNAPVPVTASPTASNQ